MNPDFNKIFAKSSCLTKSEMKEYLSGNLSDKDKRNVEIHISDCEMCSDELEGLSNMKNINALPLIVSSLNDDIDSHIQKSIFVAGPDNSKKYNFKRIFSVAASVALLISVGYLINYFANTTTGDLAQVEKVDVNEEFTEEISDFKQKNEIPDELINKLNENKTEIKDNAIIDEASLESGKFKSEKEVVEILDEDIITDKEINDEIYSEAEEVVEEENFDKRISTVVNDLSNKTKKEVPKAEVEVNISNNEELTKDRKKSFFSGTRGNIPMEANSNKPAAGYNYISLRNSGLLSYNIKSYNESEADFINYLKYKPEDYEIVYKLGMSYYYQKKYNSSIKQFDKIIAGDINKYVEDAQWYKSIALINQGKKEEALEILNVIVFKNGKYLKRALDAINQLEE